MNEERDTQSMSRSTFGSSPTNQDIRSVYTLIDREEVQGGLLHKIIKDLSIEKTMWDFSFIEIPHNVPPIPKRLKKLLKKTMRKLMKKEMNNRSF